MRPLPGLALPGMPQNLSRQQQDEFRRHQGRLREINTKLDNLEAEAARVDALPRGHRDRSPSPPPGKYLFVKKHRRLIDTNTDIISLSRLYLQSMAPMVRERTRVLFDGDSATLRNVRTFSRSS